MSDENQIPREDLATSEEKLLAEEISLDRQYFRQVSHEGFVLYGKTVVALSGGGLGLTLTFFSKSSLNFDDKSVTLVALAWIFWGLSCTFVAFSYLRSATTHQNAYVTFSKAALAPLSVSNEATPESKVAPVKRKIRWTIVLNYLAGLAFLFGFICILLFGINHLENGEDKPEKIQAVS